MKLEDILTKIDHTMLFQCATTEDIKTLCDEAVKYNAASVCIPPVFIPFARDYTKGKLNLCTVIGFPNGNSTTEVKAFEAKKAIEDGASEIDMVINLSMLKDKNYSFVENEIKSLRKVTEGKILKVIIETCFLTEEEKIKMCEIVTEAKADFIKTSTGFGKGGATLEDVELFKKHVGKNVKIKAAGGIRTLSDAEKFIERGASRIGASAIIKSLE